MSAQPLYQIVRARRQLHREIEIAKKRGRESYCAAQELNLLRTPIFFFLQIGKAFWMICFWPLALLLAPTDIYVSLNKDKHAMIFARALGEKNGPPGRHCAFF